MLKVENQGHEFGVKVGARTAGGIGLLAVDLFFTAAGDGDEVRVLVIHVAFNVVELVILAVIGREPLFSSFVRGLGEHVEHLEVNPIFNPKLL